MLAGRPAVDTGWDERAAAIGGDLVPFHEWDDVITVVRDPVTCGGGAAARERRLTTRSSLGAG